jgi:hypothetical protein
MYVNYYLTGQMWSMGPAFAINQEIIAKIIFFLKCLIIWLLLFLTNLLHAIVGVEFSYISLRSGLLQKALKVL